MTTTDPVTTTEAGATRDKERARAAILTAAAQMVSEHGAGVSLSDIARRAGLSKGALTHHFPSRDALVAALVTDVAERFWREVHNHVDLSENRPGKLTRAYVRTLTSGSGVTREVFSPTSVLVALGNEAGVGDLAAADAGRWREAFAADGLDPAMSLVVRSAAEGLALDIGTAYLTEEERVLATARLLALAEPAD